MIFLMAKCKSSCKNHNCYYSGVFVCLHKISPFTEQGVTSETWKQSAPPRPYLRQACVSPTLAELHCTHVCVWLLTWVWPLKRIHFNICRTCTTRMWVSSLALTWHNMECCAILYCKTYSNWCRWPHLQHAKCQLLATHGLQWRL